MWYSIVGMLIALAGGFCISSIPLVEMVETAAGWGGGDDDQWDKFHKTNKIRSRLGNSLIILGTGLQIFGGFQVEKPNKSNDFRSPIEAPSDRNFQSMFAEHT